MPVKNRCSHETKPNAGRQDSQDISEAPMNVSKRRSPRNNNQLKISNMFTSKRNRSPTDDNAIKPKKLKYETEKTNMDSVDKDSSSSTDTENIKAEYENNVTKDLTNNEVQNLVSKDVAKSNELVSSVDDSKKEETLDNQEETDNCRKENDVIKNNPVVELKKNIPDTEKCDICGQFLNNSDIIYYQGHPQDAVEEYIALTNEKLVLASGDDGDITERPQTNITSFSIFDAQGHLCPIDGGLVENDVRIYMSGYLKSICSESHEIDEDSVPVKDVGPIIE